MRGDDVAGLAVAERLREGGAPVVVAQPANLIDAWAGMRDVIVVDTVYSGAAAGTVHRIDAGREPLPAQIGGSSTHGLGLADAIELARAVSRLPSRLRIVGIEGHAFGVGDELSADVERAVALVADELIALVTEGPIEAGGVADAAA
jgi:hydrogenase maturation protease